MEVIIDSREQSRIELATKYYEDLGYNVKIKKNLTGDYIFNKTVAFEYKNYDDLIGSILDGRMKTESLTQTEHFPYHFIIINGTTRDLNRALKNPYRTFSMEQLQGMIARLNTYTTVIQSMTNLNDCFYMMHKQAEKCLDNKTQVKDFGTKSINPAFNLLAYCVDNISGERAKAIVKHLNLHTIRDVCRITPADLVTVPGIGDKLAEQIYNAIGG